MVKNPNQKSILESVIRKYLNEDCFIQQEIEANGYEFGFEIKYPKFQDEKGNQKGRAVAILKPKEKNFLEINNKIRLDETGLQVVKDFDNNQREILNREIRGFLINQNLLQSINLEKNDIFFQDKIYFTNSNYVNINVLYHSIIKVINAQIVVMNILSVKLQIKNMKDSNNSYFK